jgi:hypothetical protein
MWYLEHLRSGKGDRKGCPAAIRWAILEKQPARRMVPDVDTNVDAARLEVFSLMTSFTRGLRRSFTQPGS